MREYERRGGATKGLREEEEGEEKETAAVDAVKIAALLGTLFVICCFYSPSSFAPTTSKYKRKRELTFSTGVKKAREMTKRNAA